MSALRQFLANTAKLQVGQLFHTVGHTASKLASGHYILVGAEQRSPNAITARLLRVTCMDPFETEHPAVAYDIPNTDAQAALGATLTAAPRDMIKQLFKFQLQKGGKANLFDPNFDYDKLFRALGAKYMSKSPIHLDPQDKEDYIIDVLHQILNPKTVQELKPGLDPIKYFGGMFQMRMQTMLKKMVTRKMKQKMKPGDDDRTDDEYLDSLAPADNRQDEDLDYKSLLTDLRAFLVKKPEGRYYGPMFDMMLQGATNREVAEKLNVSPPIITRYLQRMKDAILEYAKKTDNSTLFTVMTQMLHQKKHDRQRADDADQQDVLVDVFKTLKKKLATDAAAPRKPAGQTTSIVVKAAPDVLSDDYIAKLILSDQVTQDVIDDSGKNFLSFLEGQDDIIETESGVIGLRVQTSDIRPLKPQR